MHLCLRIALLLIIIGSLLLTLLSFLRLRRLLNAPENQDSKLEAFETQITSLLKRMIFGICTSLLSSIIIRCLNFLVAFLFRLWYASLGGSNPFVIRMSRQAFACPATVEGCLFFHCIYLRPRIAFHMSYMKSHRHLRVSDTHSSHEAVPQLRSFILINSPLLLS